MPAFQLAEPGEGGVADQGRRGDGVGAKQAAGGEASSAVERGAVGIGHADIRGGDGQAGLGDAGSEAGRLAAECVVAAISAVEAEAGGGDGFVRADIRVGEFPVPPVMVTLSPVTLPEMLSPEVPSVSPVVEV